MKVKLLFIPLLLVFFYGCEPGQKTIYYWSEYSESLYKYKKTTSDTTRVQFKKTLADIINNAAKKNKKIPPGVCAEYGFFLMQDGKQTEGLQFMDKEMALYPESSVFVLRIKNEAMKGGK